MPPPVVPPACVAQPMSWPLSTLCVGSVGCTGGSGVIGVSVGGTGSWVAGGTGSIVGVVGIGVPSVGGIGEVVTPGATGGVSVAVGVEGGACVGASDCAGGAVSWPGAIVSVTGATPVGDVGSPVGDVPGVACMTPTPESDSAPQPSEPMAANAMAKPLRTETRCRIVIESTVLHIPNPGRTGWMPLRHSMGNLLLILWVFYCRVECASRAHCCLASNCSSFPIDSRQNHRRGAYDIFW